MVWLVLHPDRLCSCNDSDPLRTEAESAAIDRPPVDPPPPTIRRSSRVDDSAPLVLGTDTTMPLGDFGGGPNPIVRAAVIQK